MGNRQSGVGGWGSKVWTSGQLPERLIFSDSDLSVKNERFRVHMAPFDKMMIDFKRFRRPQHDSDLLKAENQRKKYSTQFINITLSMVKKTSVTQISPGSSEGKGGKQDLARPSLELAKIFTRYGWKTNKEDYWIWNICRFFVILQKQTIQAVQCSVHNRCLQEDMLSKRTGLICAMIWIKVT